jgi:hypothetical protein
VSCAAPAKPLHGFLPPSYDESVHTIRCLAQLRSKDKDIEKYIYLTQLKDTDPPMFYRLCLDHMPVRQPIPSPRHNQTNIFLAFQEITPLIYTPTVGDACLQFSHNYRRPEGLVSRNLPKYEFFVLIVGRRSSFQSRTKVASALSFATGRGSTRHASVSLQMVSWRLLEMPIRYDLTSCTTGSRILGLGDLGVNGNIHPLMSTGM